MRGAHSREIQYYRNQNGRAPFTEWLQSIRDPKTQNRILRRLDRLTRGNFGEGKSVGGGVFELILDFGPGYRIYFSEIRNIVVFYFVVVIRDRSFVTLSVQKRTGENTRR